MANGEVALISTDQLMQIIRETVASEFKKLQTSKESKPPMDEEPITVEEAAKFLRVSKVTIHKWKKNNLIPFRRLKRRIYFQKHELLNAMNFLTLKNK